MIKNKLKREFADEGDGTHFNSDVEVYEVADFVEGEINTSLPATKARAMEVFLDYDGKFGMSERGIAEDRIKYLNEKLQRIINEKEAEFIVNMFHPSLRWYVRFGTKPLKEWGTVKQLAIIENSYERKDEM